ncbi:MAG: glycosyltransferase family 39 protein [Chloroflexi bacterium]|nr:glycosyltransferase family 39 protein [Chloroflexota bacterium]
MRIGPQSAVLVLAAALRCYRLDGQSLWYDEGVSAFMTTRGPVEIARAAAADIHPPLYYWLLAAWAVPFGNGEIALRALSVVLGTASVWVVWRLGRALYGEAVGLVAAALLAISPLAVQYSQEVRMYALAGLLAAASTWAYWGFVMGFQRASRMVSRPTAVLYGLLAAALLYTHYYGVLVLAAHHVHFGLSLAMTRRWGMAPSWLLASGVAAALYLPWLPHALRQTGNYPGLGTPQPSWAMILDAVNALSIGLATTRFAFRLGLAPFLALAVVGILASRESKAEGPGHGAAVEFRPSTFDGSGRVLLLLWLVLPIAAIVVLSAGRPLYEPRFLVLVLPAWVILVAAGAVTVSRAVGRLLLGQLLPTARVALGGALAAGAIALLLVPTGRSLAAYYLDPAYARDDYRGLARRVAALERPGDAVVLTAPGQAEIFRYYYHGSADLFPLPAQRPIDSADTRARLEAVGAGHARVWLVRWAFEEADPDDLIGRWLESHAQPVGQERFGRVELRLYELRASASRLSDGNGWAVRTPAKSFGAPTTMPDHPLRANS